MSADWIEGRFEGVYAGRLRGAASARNARRFAIELKSGTVTQPRRCAAPPDEQYSPERDEIRQDHVDGIALPLEPGAEEVASPGRSLYDLRLRDFQLSHPAEAAGQAYGTVTGTILARLSPPEAAERSTAVEDDLEPEKSALTDALRETRAHRNGSEVIGTDASVLYARVRLAFGLLVLLVVAIAIAMLCDARAAVIFASPIAGALLLRRLTNAATRPPQHGWGVGIAALQWATLGLMILGGELGCGAASATNLALLGAPVLVAGLVSVRWPLVLCSLLWTAVVCSACTGTGPVCEPAMVSAQRSGEITAEAATTAGALSRTGVSSDRAGPGAAAGPLASPPRGAEAAGASSPHIGGSGAGPAQAAPARAHAAAPRTDPSGRWPVMPTPTSSGTEARSREQNGESPSGPTAPQHRIAPDTPSDRRTHAPSAAGTKGGWVAAEDGQSLRDAVLISIEQANREPARFFESDGSRRVYLPTDEIFEPAGAEVSPTGVLQLTRLAALLSLHPDRPVTLEVHTDAGDASAALSEQRAAALRSWLEERGHLRGDQFDVVGVGSARPLVPPDGSYAAQQPNRRVEARLR